MFNFNQRKDGFVRRHGRLYRIESTLFGTRVVDVTEEVNWPPSAGEQASTDSTSKTKQDLYEERNLLALAFLHALEDLAAGSTATVETGWWPDHDDVNGEPWAVVWADLPHGQVGWHVPREMVPDWLTRRDPDYDGYSTAEKNCRVAEFARLDEWPAPAASEVA